MDSSTKDKAVSKMEPVVGKAVGGGSDITSKDKTKSSSDKTQDKGSGSKKPSCK